MSKWGIEEQETLEAIKKMKFTGHILNVAAGDGRFNNLILETATKVTAIDISEPELELLKKDCPNNLKNKLVTEKLDITKRMPYQDQTFDGIFCTGTLHLFEEEVLTNILSEIKRILKPNGKLILDFATDITRLDKNNNPVTFDQEGNYHTSEAKRIFTEQFNNFDLEIQESVFTEENLDDEAGYHFITGKFLIASGIKSHEEN